MNTFFILCFFTLLMWSSAIPVKDEHEAEDKSRAKRSMTRDSEITLTGMERISKRSIAREEISPLTGTEKITKRSADDDGLSRERRYVFLPNFASRRRVGRSVDALEDFDEDNEDVYSREKRFVFLPGFAKRRQRRSLVEDDDEEDSERNKRSVFLPGFARRRVGRSIEDEERKREKRTVFLPNFARRRFTRSVKTEDAEDNDDLEGVETSAILLPLFATRAFRKQ